MAYCAVLLFVALFEDRTLIQTPCPHTHTPGPHSSQAHILSEVAVDDILLPVEKI